MLDEVLDVLVEGHNDRLARLPLGRVLDVVEGADDLEERLGRCLANAVVVVRELGDELDCALLDKRQEVHASGGEDTADGVRSDLLLDADRAVDVEQLVDVDVEVFAVEAVNGDGGSRGRARSEAGSVIGYEIPSGL